MKINSPLRTKRKERITYDQQLVRRHYLILPTIDSTNNCPLLGTNEVLPIIILITRMINKDIIQLVIIELVTGKGPIIKATSAVKLTPPAPAPNCGEREKKMKTKTFLAISFTHKDISRKGQ